MKVQIRRHDKTIPLPEFKTKGAAGFDLYTRETVTVNPRELKLIPLNISIKIPSGYFLLVAERSSTHKYGISMANKIGVLDSDFCGNNDELKFAAYNLTDSPITVEKATRIAQGVVLKCDKIELEEVDDLGEPDRGGFGTTGNK